MHAVSASQPTRCVGGRWGGSCSRPRLGEFVRALDIYLFPSRLFSPFTLRQLVNPCPNCITDASNRLLLWTQQAAHVVFGWIDNFQATGIWSSTFPRPRSVVFFRWYICLFGFFFSFPRDLKLHCCSGCSQIR